MTEHRADRSDGGNERPKGRPRRSPDERERRRVRLVEGAMEAVRRYGSDVALDQIADAVGVSKPVLYAEFRDKNGLVDAMAVVLAARVEKTVFDRVTEAGGLSPDRVIGAIIEAVINLIDDEPNLYGYLVRSLRMRDRGFLDNALVRVIHDRAAVIVGGLASDLIEGELDVLADGVFGFVFGVVESWVATRTPPKAELVTTMAAVVRAGLAEVTERRRARPGDPGRPGPGRDADV